MTCILLDQNGDLWFGTGNGISHYDGKRFVNYTIADGLHRKEINAMFQTREGHLWFATYLGGASRFDGREFVTYSPSDGLAHQVVLSVFQDSKGRMWFGTVSGVSVFDPSKNIWRTFTKEDGLGSNYVYGITEDQDNHLWFATSEGATRYDGRVFQILTTEDGVAENHVVSVFQDISKNVWFGTYNGLTRYRQPVHAAPHITLDAVVADRRYVNKKSVTLPSPAGLMAFEFHGKSFKTRPDAIVYRYRLSGLDKDWKTTRTPRVEYQDIPMGTYLFEVYAVDRDLIYSIAPATIALNIQLPYENIGWGAALSLALSLAIWQTIRVIRRDRRLQVSNNALIETNQKLSRLNQDLHEKTAMLTCEIVENERIKAIQEQLDSRFHHLQYLYQLRTMLSETRTPRLAIQQTGLLLKQTLFDTVDGKIQITYAGNQWASGNGHSVYNEHYAFQLQWNNREHGLVELFSDTPLSEIQQGVLLAETVGHLSQKLEALELEMQLLQSSRLVSMGEMAAGVAHELNQPLSALATTVGDVYLRLLDDIQLTPEELKEMMKDASEFVARMEEIITHLRVFARDETDTPHVRVDVNAAVHGSLKMIGTQLKNRGIALQLDLADVLPKIEGHPHQLEQVVMNLLSNARDALEDVEGRAKHIVVKTFERDDFVIFEMMDNGKGIAPEHVAHVFEPFFTTKHSSNGMGLGLSISHAIVKNHRGKIECQSEKGSGTTFRVTLPIDQSHDGVQNG